MGRGRMGRERAKKLLLRDFDGDGDGDDDDPGNHDGNYDDDHDGKVTLSFLPVCDGENEYNDSD